MSPDATVGPGFRLRGPKAIHDVYKRVWLAAQTGTKRHSCPNVVSSLDVRRTVVSLSIVSGNISNDSVQSVLPTRGHVKRSPMQPVQPEPKVMPKSGDEFEVKSRPRLVLQKFNPGCALCNKRKLPSSFGSAPQRFGGRKRSEAASTAYLASEFHAREAACLSNWQALVRPSPATLKPAYQ